MANTSLHEHAPHLSGVEARQGSRGRHILTVLIASVILTALALALAWGWRAGEFRRVDVRTRSSIAASEPSGAPIVRPPAPLPQNPATNGLNR